MTSSRKPGALGLTGVSLPPFGGTSSRTPTSRPGVLGLNVGSTRLQGDQPEPADSPRAAGSDSRADVAEKRVIEVIHARQSSFQVAGRWMRLIQARQWSKFGHKDKHEVVAREEARLILEHSSETNTASRTEQAAFKEAALLLADPTSRSLGTGLLLLLRKPASRFSSSSPVELVTPSQLASMLQRENEETEHWIEIELVFPDGKYVVNERFRIATPDLREITGVTDSRGRARVDSIVVDGSCTIGFPDLYDDEWRLA